VNALKQIYFFEETTTHVYDPASDGWTVGTSMPTARGYAGIAVIGDLLYTVGGIKGTIGLGEMYPISNYGVVHACWIWDT
jgi:hypothetical protein